MNALPNDLEPFTETADSMLDSYQEAHAQGCPVVNSTAHGGYYMVHAHAATREAAKDWRTFSSAQGVSTGCGLGVALAKTVFDPAWGQAAFGAVARDGNEPGAALNADPKFGLPWVSYSSLTFTATMLGAVEAAYFSALAGLAVLAVLGAKRTSAGEPVAEGQLMQVQIALVGARVATARAILLAITTDTLGRYGRSALGVEETSNRGFF